MPEREEVGRGLVGGGGAMVMIVESWSREGWFKGLQRESRETNTYTSVAGTFLA